jgi:hypothetical protein
MSGGIYGEKDVPDAATTNPGVRNGRYVGLSETQDNAEVTCNCFILLTSLMHRREPD